MAHPWIDQWNYQCIKVASLFHHGRSSLEQLACSVSPRKQFYLRTMATSWDQLEMMVQSLLQHLGSFFRSHVIHILGLLWGRLTVARVLTRTERSGVGPCRPLPSRPVPNATHQVLNGHPHFLVLVRVDAGVHDRVENSQEQQPAFQLHDLTACAVDPIQQQNYEARSPAEHKCPCRKSQSG